MESLKKVTKQRRNDTTELDYHPYPPLLLTPQSGLPNFRDRTGRDDSGKYASSNLHCRFSTPFSMPQLSCSSVHWCLQLVTSHITDNPTSHAYKYRIQALHNWRYIRYVQLILHCCMYFISTEYLHTVTNSHTTASRNCMVNNPSANTLFLPTVENDTSHLM